MGYIAHLPKSVIGQLRSSSILSDLAQAVEELICNSLDAGAKKISVYVDLSSFSIKVEDDGSGVTRDDLKLIGERHATSKLHDMVELESGVSTLGFRGEALSSLSDIGVVEIITRTRGSPNTYKKILKGSKKLSLGLYGEQRAPGTTVVLRELFHNLPVRRKVIQSSPRKVFQGVKDRTVRLALIHPDVSFRVFDMDRQENLIRTKSCSSSLDTLCEFFGEHLRHELYELHFAKECLKLDAFISKETSRFTSKAVQFLYLNGRFVHKTPVHKLINTLFLRGSCGQELGNPLESGFSCAVVKQVYPMFLINLHCPLSSYDITFEATKTSVEFKDWKSILSFITEALGTKWSRLTRNLDEEYHLAKHDVTKSKKLSPRKQKLSWQRVDPSDRPRCSKDTPKADDWLGSVGGIQTADQYANTEQDLTFCIAKGIRTPRKKRAYQEHNFSDLSAFPWSFQPCRARRKLDSDARYEGNQHDPGGMENLWYEKESFQGSWGERSTSGVLHDDVLDPIVGSKSQGGLSVQDVLCQDNSLLTFTNFAEIHTSSPVGDLHTHPRQRVTSLDGRRDPLFLECVAKRENLGCGESTNAIIDFMQTPPRLHRSFSVSSSGVRRCLYELNMKSSCTDDFWCHSERQTVSNLEIQYKNLDREGLWNNERATPCVDFPGPGFSKGCEGEFEEGCQHDYMPSLNGNGRLLEYKSSLYSQQRGIDKFDSMLTHAVNKFSFLGKEGKASPYHLLMEATVDELIERPHSKEIGISSFLTPFKHSVDKEIVCQKRGRNSPQHGSKQITSKDILEGPTNGRLRRSLSAPPFYQPPIKYGASNGLLTLRCPREHQNRYKLQAGVEQAQGFSTADMEKVAQKERKLASPLKDGHLSSTIGVDFTFKKRGSQEEMLLHEDSGFSPANNDGGNDLQSKWRDTVCDDMAAKGVTAIQLYKNWKNPCIRSIEPSILNLSSGILGPSNKHLLPESIRKEGLQKIQVLQQMDKKFIASVAERTLVVIDQHAADERIRLEQLRKEVLEENRHLSTLLDYPKKLSISVGDQQLLHTYKAQVEEWGWRFKLIVKGKNGERSEQGQHGSSTVLLTAVPSILGESLSNAEHLSEYLHQLTTTDGTSVPPPAVQRVLASKACRGAIMFGDHLLRSECQQLVEGLKKTALSFQCAHGRPTLVPIVNLEALHSRLNKLRSKTNTTDEPDSSSWHGLVWHRPTLVRAMERLERAEEM